nr:gametocyte-specific factor 1 [Nothobranchius furzeri]XP_015822536.2 gametocyte-specific factor 1 [Nothobranchius furzeri]XP_015822537.2 gametocyte-specific factor 1 [Nothobranchius furzeri]XP_015822538.2 gametocyte-specific factor 1 [Nothobranchius furzeri]XP_054601699.1 gametocyte-specific factor 1 [Nothobranchius furzeri]
MASFRFGTTTSPCRTSSTTIPQQPEENDIKDTWDPERLVQCPYDKNHQIRVARFPYHIIKCRKNHPKLAKELKTCPFNARHLLPKHELAAHMETCENRVSVFTESDMNDECSWKVPVSTWVNPNMTEDWDTEVDDAAAPFVWGVNAKLSQRPDVKPTTIDNGLKLRSPRTAPWDN